MSLYLSNSGIIKQLAEEFACIIVNQLCGFELHVALLTDL